MNMIMMQKEPGIFHIPKNVLDDLCARFLLNLPKEERSDLIRVCFQIELAHWFYLDFYCNNPDFPNCRQCGIREFIRTTFHHCPFLQRHESKVDELVNEWRQYKSAVPTYGAIMLDKSMESVVMVQGYYAKNSWGFPKGKVNETEAPDLCAVREVMEETGYDCAKLLKSKHFLEHTQGEGLTRLYIVPGVSKDYDFKPQTRKEIRSIKWFPLKDLPVDKNDTSHASIGIYPNHFFTAVPFIGPLRAWIEKRKSRTRPQTDQLKLNRQSGQKSAFTPTKLASKPSAPVIVGEILPATAWKRALKTFRTIFQMGPKTPRSTKQKGGASVNGGGGGAFSKQFKPGDKVFVEDGDWFWSAKVREETEQTCQADQYVIHYDGWNQRHDEIVEADCVHPWTEENQERAKKAQELYKHQKHPKRSSKGSASASRERSDSRASTPSIEGSSRKASSVTASSETGPVVAATRRTTQKHGGTVKPDAHVETEDAYYAKSEVNVKIPEELKPYLVDDWDLVIHQCKLVRLPAKPTVQEIINDYIKYKDSTTKDQAPTLVEKARSVARGTVDFFNIYLGFRLLYKFERLQYAEICKSNPGKPMSEIYGAWHLLRLFVQVGYLMANTAMHEKDVKLVVHCLQDDLLKWLAMKKDDYFGRMQDDYITADPDYVRAAYTA